MCLFYSWTLLYKTLKEILSIHSNDSTKSTLVFKQWQAKLRKNSRIKVEILINISFVVRKEMWLVLLVILQMGISLGGCYHSNVVRVSLKLSVYQGSDSWNRSTLIIGLKHTTK